MKTTKFSVDDTGTVIVTVTASCSKVTVVEDPGEAGWPNGDYQVKGMEGGSAFTTVPGGVKTVWERNAGQQRFQPGDQLAYIKLGTGITKNFKMVED